MTAKRCVSSVLSVLLLALWLISKVVLAMTFANAQVSFRFEGVSAMGETRVTKQYELPVTL